MMPTVNLEASTIERMKQYAEPLVDTLDTVILRGLDALDSQNANSSPSERILSPDAPPNLSYTTVKSIVFNGKRFAPAETYWNPLLIAAIREAKKKLGTKEKVQAIVICNKAMGKKEDNGYKYLEDVGISIQGQDANNAWKATYHILKEIKVPVEVEFVWQDNPKAMAPGSKGKFTVAFD